MHPSAWKRNSANFVMTEFSEVRQCFIADPSPTGNRAGMSRENAEGAALMRRIFVLALYISVLLGLCVVHSQSFIWRWNAGVIGFHRS